MNRILTIRRMGEIILANANTDIDSVEDLLTINMLYGESDYKRCVTIGEIRRLQDEYVSFFTDRLQIKINVSNDLREDKRLATELWLNQHIEQLDSEYYEMQAYLMINGVLTDTSKTIKFSRRELDSEMQTSYKNIVFKMFGTTSTDYIKNEFGGGNLGDFESLSYKDSVDGSFHDITEDEDFERFDVNPNYTGTIYLNYTFSVNEAEMFSLTYKYLNTTLKTEHYASGATVDLTRYIPYMAGYNFVAWYNSSQKVTQLVMDKDYVVRALFVKEGTDSGGTSGGGGGNREPNNRYPDD